MRTLEISNLSHWFGTKRVLHNVNLQVDEGQFVSLVGPSGCGKSTLFRAVLGTHPPCAGQVLVNGRPIEKPCRDVGIVYQHYSLYDFLTAQENVAIGLMLDGTNLPFRAFQPWDWWPLRREHLKQAAAWLDKVGLPEAAKQYPAEMSGGMRQRVAVAQALILRPKLLLLDEPFGALDEAIREELQVMLLHLYQENLAAKKNGQPPPHTIVIVTHELTEAIYVADRVVGLSQYHQDGQLGATIVYDKPASVFHVDDAGKFDSFQAQKDEIRRVVFDPQSRQNYEEYVTFWTQQQAAAT